MKKKILISGIAIILLVGVIVAVGVSTNKKKTPQDMSKNIESAIKEVFGDEYKKQSETVLAGTLKYSDQEGNAINYHILKTTYYEADPLEITGLNIDALGTLFNIDGAKSCKEMKIKDWDAALYEFDELSYLCWTYSPEVSYALEYNPKAIADEEIIKMAESAEVPKED